MQFGIRAASAAALIVMLGACGGGASNTAANGANAASGNAAAPANSAAGNSAGANSSAAAPAGEQSGLGPSTETVRLVENCVLETPEGYYDGACERVEWGGPSFSIRRAGGVPFYGQVTEAIVEVDRPGEAAGGSYRNGGELVSAGPLSFRDDCACWVRPNMRVGAQAQ